LCVHFAPFAFSFAILSVWFFVLFNWFSLSAHVNWQICFVTSFIFLVVLSLLRKLLSLLWMLLHALPSRKSKIDIAYAWKRCLLPPWGRRSWKSGANHRCFHWMVIMFPPANWTIMSCTC
jgi:hypothetical protein